MIDHRRHKQRPEQQCTSYEHIDDVKRHPSPKILISIKNTSQNIHIYLRINLPHYVEMLEYNEIHPNQMMSEGILND